jgi:bacillithiol biosynthesis cysteine-adding enzyme BshC
MDWIDFRVLPASSGGFSELFMDFVYDFPKVRQFFSYDFRDPNAYTGILQAIDRKGLDRRALVEVLRSQNEAFGAPPKTLENIGLLLKPGTYAVVTGQQVGLFGGPLYTIFKAITAIKLCSRLKESHPRYEFVPVFWIEGEDHDFAEMNHIGLLDAESKLVRVEYLPGGVMPERNLGPIGELAFDTALEQTFERLTATLQKTDFTEKLLEELRRHYSQGRTFNQAFTGWMGSLFRDAGLIFISANEPRLKRALSPLFVREITEFPAISQIVINQSAELEKSYHAQVKAKSVNLFMFQKGGRYLIEPRENDFSLKGTRHFISKEEMLKIGQETPELLSPNVILRPLAQDILLPTAVYVAGPSEVAYHAQLKPVYDHLGVPQPVIYPRASASYLEERLRRALEKYELELLDFFADIGRVTDKVVGQISEVKLDVIFGNATQHVRDALNELKFGLNEIDPTLLGSLENTTGKIDTTIAILKEKAASAQKRRNETAVRQVEKAANSLRPNASLQEREISILHYMNKYGPDFLQWTTERLDVSGFKHQILTI